MRTILYGSLAGCAATVPMTSAMHRLHRRLPAHEQYSLPPGEILQVVAGRRAGPAKAMLAHFGYGALMGALFAQQPRRSIFIGVARNCFWAGSYLGWIPSVGILSPASEHPLRRSGLMLAVHALWGAVLATALSEIELADDAFGGSAPAVDRPHHHGVARSRPERTP
jgi:hypothetical protein